MSDRIYTISDNEGHAASSTDGEYGADTLALGYADDGITRVVVLDSPNLDPLIYFTMREVDQVIDALKALRADVEIETLEAEEERMSSILLLVDCLESLGVSARWEGEQAA